MMARVLLASCAELPESDGDDTALPAVLGEVGVSAGWAPWDDPAVDFAAADLVILRATWDYPARRAEFLKWCESVPNLANPADVVRWNTDKHYLVDLAASGLDVVPTQLIAPGSAADWPDGEFVLKPSVGAGSRGAGRFGPGSLDAAREHLDGLHADSHVVVLQPYQEAVDREGETALVFLGGAYSHAFVKGAMLSESAALDDSGLFVGETLRPVVPEPALRRAAEDAMDGLGAFLGTDRRELLYARVDLVRASDGRPLLLELELAEPSLGFQQTDGGAQLRFASAVRAALARR
ncbi:ATP-grasp domain-containing protein [Saccharopolyspora sp. 5N708]|uniref:ATP-grasp domain-containing protein n=1 Tax=Saccharopolyspora sp. 5N708 TaxID=3457424 RepID=UPI003FD4DCA4